MSAKQAINDNIQCSVATYFRCGGIVNNQIKKGLLLSQRVKKIKLANIWQSYKQERDCLVHFLCLLAPCNLSLMGCFAGINVSQGSVATARRGGVFKLPLSEGLPRNLSVKKM